MDSMRVLATVFGSCVALVLATSGPAMAADDGFAAFWKTFVAAVVKDDKVALAGMVGPVLAPFSEFHAHDLKPSVRRCLAKGKFVRDFSEGLGLTYYVKCDKTDYVFQQVDGAWKLNDLELDD
jgi:hypothetical protein